MQNSHSLHSVIVRLQSVRSPIIKGIVVFAIIKLVGSAVLCPSYRFLVLCPGDAVSNPARSASFQCRDPRQRTPPADQLPVPLFSAPRHPPEHRGLDTLAPGSVAFEQIAPNRLLRTSDTGARPAAYFCGAGFFPM